ncbi:hypothetical protein TWF225_001239 [Orbilia oligospora]|uniref:Uncharacterized protein n=1 Tax=Orbilia oligospora TaxID=2813651 RepID=A0A7C8PUX2_ORBOL|nr:hypothetical protein TWF225_001239 [Orbilia oligospora]KAF3180614.1 hypothetical protein TWF751_010989 [Orbilia oligospora]KAF3233976.1 hypothetical protein TWF128_002664 [Orbilia oligospora]KAF3240997.1 hypothetical protein TWF217_000679 [Orbilia oligospora]KAF3298487.1 hypothetical protein TWF132_000295 [Orbilia oligospora]
MQVQNITTMEGVLSVPPERNLLSRGNWKNRYVVLGPRKVLSNTSAPRKMSAVGVSYDEDLGSVEDVFSNHSEDDFPARYFPDMRLSIYRQRMDPEPMVSYSLDCVTSCYVGDIAHRKAFSSMSKTTYNPLCPTLVVNLQLDTSFPSSRRKGMDSPTASVSQLYEPDDGKLTLFFRSGPKDTPLTIWCREIQSHIRSTNSRRSSSITFGGDKAINSRHSYRATAYDLKIAEDEWEEERADHHHHDHSMIPTTRSSEESGESSGGSRTGAPRPISTLMMHEFGPGPSISTNQSPIDPHEMSPTGGSEYMACASLSSSPRRETILDRAFSMNYIPSSPTLSTTSHFLSTPPINSVARFEAVAADPSLSRDYRYSSRDADPSVMPASFFKFK